VNRAQATGSRRVACLIALLGFAMGGCVTHRPVLESGALSVELTRTPFHPQQRFQCGPAALATVLGASDVDVTPAQLEPLVYLPGRKGSLQIEMQAAPRQFGRLAYRVDPSLASLTAELDAGRPVLVLHNYGLPLWPRWHYAVLIGYDGSRDELLLRSGTVEREIWSARNFMRAWDNGDRWALVMLRPGELPAALHKDRYMEAAIAFEKLASPVAAQQVFDAAVRTWPDEAVGWTGRGTANFRLKDFRQAARDYSRALDVDPSLAGARNNLAMALMELGCTDQARLELGKIEVQSLSGSLRAEVEDTAALLRDRPAALSCPGI